MRTTVGGFEAELARLEAQAELSFTQEAELLRLSGVVAPATILEIGAGSGAVTRRLAAAYPDASLIALDIDPRLLSHAPPTATRIIGDALRLPFADASVDCVLLRYVLQHLADPVAVLREARRVVKPGGHAALIDVDDACWGLAEPAYPEMGIVHAKTAAAQRRAGGSRAVGRRLTRWLTEAGFAEPRLRLFTMGTDDHPVEAFAPHLGPGRLQQLVAKGDLGLTDLALAAGCWERFRRDPEAYVVLIGFLATGVARQ